MEARLSADKEVENLSVEELDCLLKQLIDRSVPEREKCPLVQRLNAEDALATNNTSFVTLDPSTGVARNVTVVSRSATNSSISNSTSTTNTTTTASAAAAVVVNNISNEKLRTRLRVLSKERELGANGVSSTGTGGGSDEQQSQPPPPPPPSKQPTDLPPLSPLPPPLSSTTTKFHCRQHPSELVNYAQKEPLPKVVGATNCCDDDGDNSIKLALTTSNIAQPNNHNSASSSQRTSAGVGCGGSSSSTRKPNRANSFTMPSTSDNSDTNTSTSTTTSTTIITSNNTSQIFDHHHHLLTNGGSRNSDTVTSSTVATRMSRDVLSTGSHTKSEGDYEAAVAAISGNSVFEHLSVNNNHCGSEPKTSPPIPPPTSLSLCPSSVTEPTHSSHSVPAVVTSVSQSAFDSSHSSRRSDSVVSAGGGGASSDPKQSSTAVNKGSHLAGNQYSSVHLSNISSLVNNTSSDCAPSYQRILSEHKGLAKSNSQSLTVEEEDEEKIEFVEMKNLQRKADIIEYRSDINFDLKNRENDISFTSKNSVDRVLEMPLLTGNKNADNSSINYSVAYVSNSNSSSQPSGNTQYSNANGTNSLNLKGVRSKDKKRKRPQEVKLAQHIEGNIGYMDVSYLESFVNSTSTSNNAAIVNGFDKKGGKGKQSQKGDDSGKRSNKSNSGDKKAINSESKPATNETGDKNALTSNADKVPLNSVSNSSSMSGDDLCVNKNATKTNTSPELSSSNGTKSKKSKSKRKNKSNGKTASSGAMDCKSDNSSSNNKSDQTKSKSNGEKCANLKSASTQGMSNQNSSSDDFEDATDADYDDEDDELLALYCGSKKSNSLLPDKAITLSEEVQKMFYTVSDSEMADREKDFVTPKNKHYKKKKMQQHKSQNGEAPGHNHGESYPKGSTNKGAHSAGVAASRANNLGRGYESECSLGNCVNPNSFASQSLSSSMFTIDSKATTVPTVSHSQAVQSKFSDSNFLSNSDNELQVNITAKEAHDNGPKIPSYADIAKSFSFSSSNVKSNHSAKPPPPVSENLVVHEEFPQLDVKHISSIDSSSVPLCSKTNQAAVNSSQVTASTTTATCNKPNSAANKQATNCLSNADPQSKEQHVNTTSTGSTVDTVSQVETVVEVEETEDSCPTDYLNACSDNAINMDFDVKLSPIVNNSPPVVIFGDNSADICPMMFGGESPISNGELSHETSLSNGNKLVFGFFDDIQSEISMLQDSNYSPLDQTNDSSNDSGVNILRSLDMEDGTNKANIIPMNDMHLCDGVELEDAFYKNAVHVHDLEDHFRKMDKENEHLAQQQQLLLHHQQNPQKQKPSKLNSSSNHDKAKAFSSTASSSSLSSSFDSSPVSSYAAVPSIQPNDSSAHRVNSHKPFVSCVKKYRSLRFNDQPESELNIVNYSTLIKYVSNSWSQCSSC